MIDRILAVLSSEPRKSVTLPSGFAAMKPWTTLSSAAFVPVRSYNDVVFGLCESRSKFSAGFVEQCDFGGVVEMICRANDQNVHGPSP
jgi:hypothetical protein